MSTNLVSERLEALINSFMEDFRYMSADCDDIQKIYYTAVSSAISGYGDTDPVTQSTSLTKQDVVNGITMTEQVENFLGNSAVVTGDYYATLVNLTNGNADATSVVNNACENIGNDLKSLGDTLLTSYQRAKVIQETYVDNEIDTVVDNVSSDRIMYGGNKTVSLFSEAKTMVDQFLNFINNTDTTSGDYMSTVSNWVA